jgi:hypothetical protein
MTLGTFQNSALGISIIVLIVCLIILGIILMKKPTSSSSVDICPDYWTTSNYLNPPSACKTSEFGCCSDNTTSKTDADGSNCPIRCYNSHQLGTVSSSCSSIPTTMDFSTDDYTGSSGICNKQKWADQCGITWDGITNVSNAC